MFRVSGLAVVGSLKGFCFQLSVWVVWGWGSAISFTLPL